MTVNIKAGGIQQVDVYEPAANRRLTADCIKGQIRFRVWEGNLLHGQDVRCSRDEAVEFADYLKTMATHR